MTQDVAARLRRTLALLQELEQVPDSVPLPAEKLSLLQVLVDGFKNHTDPFVHKLTSLVTHVHPTVPRRVLADLTVPLERALGKNTADQDFLPREKDRPDVIGRKYPLRIVLDHWRSAFNVGSIIRSADGLGVEAIECVGYTPTPDSDAVLKTSLGAEVPWRHHDRLEVAIQTLRDEGYRLIALETVAHAIPLQAPFHKQKSALIIGNERFGLGPGHLQILDEVRELPLVGKKNSLNASVIGAIAAHEWIRQWSAQK